jgi:hypothetical protein
MPAITMKSAGRKARRERSLIIHILDHVELDQVNQKPSHSARGGTQDQINNLMLQIKED